MLMPILSVTAIGGLVAVAAVLSRGWGLGRALLLGVVGAWVGFVAGAAAGLIVDVVAGTGWALALFGHVTACAVALMLVFFESSLPGSRSSAVRGSGE